MQHKQGEERNQMFMFSLESAIAADSFVRVVDVFVHSIYLKSFGFANVECHEDGCPPYPPSALLKLYLYGYWHWISTIRKVSATSSGDMLQKTAKHVCRGNNAPRVKKTEGLLTGTKMLMQSKPMQRE